MGISLFQHDQKAYEAALFMLSDKSKAAVIHPTGTGKSFIGFKLCEDFPASVICWLSPSEYIFKTQMENLKSSADGLEPQNIRFFTYAKLMLMSEDEMKEIRPDYQTGKLTDDQVALLEEIGMVWNPAEEKWREGYEHAKEYLSGLDKAKWSSRYVSPDGYKTGAWLRGQQRNAQR